jgi:hypothetical protein
VYNHQVNDVIFGVELMNRILLLALVALIGVASASSTFAGTTHHSTNQATDSHDEPIDESDEESDEEAE